GGARRPPNAAYAPLTLSSSIAADVYCATYPRCTQSPSARRASEKTALSLIRVAILTPPGSSVSVVSPCSAPARNVSTVSIDGAADVLSVFSLTASVAQALRFFANIFRKSPLDE